MAAAALILTLCLPASAGADATRGSAAAGCPRPGDPISIESVALSDNPMHTGETVSGTVWATCNVAAVTAEVGTYRIGIPKVGVGLFRTSVRVPTFMWPRKLTLVVTAIRTDGATVATQVPIEVRW